MSATYHCRLCGRDFDYDHPDCDGGASRLERLEAAVVALGEALSKAWLDVPGTPAYGVMTETTKKAIEAAVKDLRGDGPGTGEG